MPGPFLGPAAILPLISLASLLGPGEWHRRVWRLAGPIMISNVSTPLLGLVDTAVIGHLDEAHHLGAVAVGALIFSFLFWTFGFLRMSTTALVAQAAGADGRDEIAAILARALALAAAIGLLLVLLQQPVGWLAFSIVQSGPDVAEGAATYFGWRIWSAPATLANYVVLGCLLGLRRAGLALCLQLVLNGFNIVLDLILVPILGWGVAGVAIASALAEYSALVVGVTMLVRIVPELPQGILPERLGDFPALGRLIRINFDILVRTLCLMAGFGLFTAQGAALGDVTLAANAVLMNLYTLMAYSLDGFANAAEVLVAGAVGARDNAAFRASVRTSTVWAAIAAVSFSLAYLAGGHLLVDLLTSIEPVRAEAKAHLPWMIVQPLFGIWAFQCDGIFIGATRGSTMRNAMVVSFLVYLGLCWVLVPLLGNHGLWLAFTGLTAMRGLTLGLAYPALARSV